MRIVTLALLLCSPACTTTSATVEYTVALPAPQTQMVDMIAEVPTAGRREVEFVLPSWRPGRYDILDPVGTMRDIRAVGDDGTALPVEQVGKARWRVASAGTDRVSFAYRMYANEARSRTRHVDDSHAFLSPSQVFVFDPEHRASPARVRINAPEGWSVATGLEPWRDDPRTLRAASYDVLADSPLEIGRHDVIDFDVDGVPHQIVLWPPGVPHDAGRLSRDFSTIILTQREIFGTLPYARYVFLVHVGVGGGGTEHLNSTIMLTSREAIEATLDPDTKAGSGSYGRFLGLVAHEFFHVWNVKQFRPAGIHPYDYERENYTDLFWVAEGTTDYYDDLTRVRAGMRTPTEHQRNLASAIGSDRASPGARAQSVAAASFNAWTKFNASSADDRNAEVSFYGKGALVSLALDLELRRAGDGTASLDDVMRALYERFPLDGPGYTTADLVALLDEFSGTSFGPFFARHVAGTDPIPFEALLPTVGLELAFEPRRNAAGPDSDAETDADADVETGSDADAGTANDEDEDPDADIPLRATLGVRASGSPARVSSVSSDGTAYPAGIIVGDEIIAIDGRRVRNLDDQVERLEPGDVVTLHVLRRDELRVLEIRVGGEPDGTWRISRVEEPTDAQQAAYEDWSGQPW